MPYELIYTSAEKGVLPGSQGFCTVACTKGLSQQQISTLELLSGYRHLYPPGSADSKFNPVVFSHLTVMINGKKEHVFSRIMDAGLDYTNRTNKLAHHLLFSSDELLRYHPGAILQKENLCFLSEWKSPPTTFPAPKTLPEFHLSGGICVRWKSLTGDAGWGGVLAYTAITGQPVCIVYSHQNLNSLLSESLALLPPEKRWNPTFSTFYTKYPPTVTCQWRCVPAGSPEENQIRKTPNVFVLDLTQPFPTLENTNPQMQPYIDFARTGSPVYTVSPVKQKVSMAPVPGGSQIQDSTLSKVKPGTVFVRRKNVIPSPVSSWENDRFEESSLLDLSTAGQISSKTGRGKKTLLIGIGIVLFLITFALTVLLLLKN